MTKDEIIRMAREAGAYWEYKRSIPVPCVFSSDEELERFAALVAAAEREACAKMAESFHQHGYDFTGDLELHEAIRARGQE